MTYILVSRELIERAALLLLIGNTADALRAALDAKPVEPVACQHVWRDYISNTGTRNIVWCHKCDTLAFAGSEHLAPPAPVPAVPDVEAIAKWLEVQRNDIPATGAEFAAALRTQYSAAPQPASKENEE